MSRLLAGERDDGPLAGLTPREREVLQLIAEGLTNQAIADRTGITLRSAEKHVSSIFAKLGLPDSGSEHRRVLAVLALPRRLTRGDPHRRDPRGTAPRDTGEPVGGAARRRDARCMSIHPPEGSSMQSVLVQPERPDAPTREAVVTARDVVRRYGEGDTAVDALRGVSVDIAAAA